MSSAEKVITIEQLLHEILLCLPTKSLLRFQCVSKQWFSIISNSHFRRLHNYKIIYPSYPSGVFLVDSEKNNIYISKSNNRYRNNKTISNNMLRLSYDLLHSCNGLVCTMSSLYIRVNNPCIGGYVGIHPLPDYKTSTAVIATNLAFDPSKSDQFKIICVRQDEIEFSFYVYSSTKSWKDSGASLDARHHRYTYSEYNESRKCFYRNDPESSQYFFGNGMFLDGKLHWVSNTKPFVCFDTENECLQKMPSTLIPSEKGRNIRYFGESGGYLHLIQEPNHRATLFNVLEMRKDYSEWYTKYQVDVDFVIRMYPKLVDDFEFHILSLMWEKDSKKMKVLLSIPDKIMYCGVDDGKINEVLDVKPHERGLYKWYHAYKYIESLARVDGRACRVSYTVV